MYTQVQESRLLGGRSRPKFTPELLDEVVQLYENGYSTIEIAEILKSRGISVTPQAIWLRLKELGKSRNRRLAQRVRRMKEKRGVE